MRSLATHPLTPGRTPGALATDASSSPAATGTSAPGSTGTPPTTSPSVRPDGETGSPAGAGEDRGRAAGDSTSGNGPSITPLAGGLIGAGPAIPLVLLARFVLRYRRHRPGKNTAETDHTDGFGGKSELPGDGASPWSSEPPSMSGKDVAGSPQTTATELPGTLAPLPSANKLPSPPVSRTAAGGLTHTVVPEPHTPGMCPAELYGEARRC